MAVGCSEKDLENSDNKDSTPPIITLNDARIITLIQGTNYVEAGASAIDDVDGTVNVTTTGFVDVNTANSYTITYTATDSANNNAVVTRTVNVEARANAGHATLTWSAPVMNEDNSTLDDLAGYKISWGNMSGVYTSEVTIMSTDLATYTIDGLAAGDYVFVIQALDTSNNMSLFSNELMKTVE